MSADVDKEALVKTGDDDNEVTNNNKTSNDKTIDDSKVGNNKESSE